MPSYNSPYIAACRQKSRDSLIGALVIKIPMTSLTGTQCIELLMDLHTGTSDFIPVEQQASSHLIFEAALV